MLNPVFFWFVLVGINVVLHGHILALKVWPCLFHSPTLVLSQCTIFLPGLWLLFIYLLVLLSGVGRALLLNIVTQNHQLTRWKLLDYWRVSIVPGFSLRGGIHKVPGVLSRHCVLFVLIMGVHVSPYFPVRRFTYCALFPWGCICPKILVVSWISVS